MKKLVSLYIIVLLPMSVSAQVALDDIDVLFVFDTIAYGSIADKSAWVEQYENQVNGLLITSGRPQLQFDFHASSTAIPYTTTGETAEGVTDWMAGPGGMVHWSSIRGANDIIFLVGGDYSNSACGRAVRESSDISFLNGNTKFVATIRLSGCVSARSLLIAHELGHVLYADHQLLYDENGFVDIGETEDHMDTDVSDPESYNHAWSEIDDSEYSIMGTPTALSRVQPRFSAADVSKGEDAYWHDVLRMFGNGIEPWGPWGDKSWSTVAAYRPIPTAPVAQVNTQMPCFCIGKEAHQDVTFTSTNLTIPDQTFVIQRQLSTGGPWTDVYEGASSCIIMDIPPGGVWQRVKILIEGMLSSDWINVFLPGCNCFNPDPPGGGF